MKNLSIILLLVLLGSVRTPAQNLMKYPVNVAQSAPAFVKFKDRIKTAEFSTPTAYDNYQIRVRNDDNTLIIQYTATGNTPGDEGLNITEGNRSHFLIVSYLNDYDINKHPQLYYALDDLKNLKSMVTEQAKMAQASDSERVAMEQKKQKEAAAQRERELAAAKQEQQQKEAQRKKELEAERLAQIKLAEKEKVALAKAEQDRLALEKEQQKLAQEHQEAIKREKAIEAEKESISQAQMDEAKRQQQELARQKELEKAHAERLAKEKREEEAKARLLAAQQEKEKLEAQNRANEEEKKYGVVGLWARYGSHGISVYEIPGKQRDWVNTDFYISKDTLVNYQMSQRMIAQNDRSIDAQYGSDFKKVNIELKDIQFKGPFTYYKIKINNPGDEDFLTGAVVAQVYDKNKAHKLELKISYFTYIGMYPLVRPHTEQYAVLVTRTPVIDNDDHVVLYVYERREERGSAFALVQGATLNKEMGKIERALSQSNKPVQQEKKGKKKRKQ